MEARFFNPVEKTTAQPIVPKFNKKTLSSTLLGCIEAQTTDSVKISEINKLIEKLTPQQTRAIISDDILYRAFKHCSIQIAEILVSRITSTDLYVFLCRLPLFNRIPMFPIFDMDKISEAEYTQLIYRRTSVFNLFHYHLQNLNRNDEDMVARRQDTRARVECFESNFYQPRPDEQFAGKPAFCSLWVGSQRYYDLCDQVMRNSTRQEYLACKKFFFSENNFDLTPRDKKVLQSLFKHSSEIAETEMVVKQKGISAHDYLPTISKPTVSSVSFLGVPMQTEQEQRSVEFKEADKPSFKHSLAVASFLASTVPERPLEVETVAQPIAVMPAYS